PTPAMPVAAADCGRPTTSGTATDVGPLETVIVIADPRATLVPAPGSWLMITPAGTVGLFNDTMVSCTPAAAASAAAIAGGLPMKPGATVIVGIGGAAQVAPVTELYNAPSSMAVPFATVGTPTVTCPEQVDAV